MVNKHLVVSLALVLGSFWAASAALAAEDYFAAGRQQLAEQRYDEAYGTLSEAFFNDPANPEVNFLLGRAAFESGRYEEAVMAYERVLMVNPEATRVKLELARSYMRLGSNELARQYFHEVLATNPPDAVWQNIQRFLAAIDAAQKKHFFNGLVTVGVGHDDNVHATPVSDRVSAYLPGLSDPLEITLTGTAAEETSNWLLNTNLVLNHVYRARYNTPWTWKTTFSNYNAFHETANDQDINLYGLSTGPNWRRDRLQVQGYVNANHIDLGFDRYLRIFGGGGSVAWAASPQWVWTARVGLQDKKFYQNRDKDSTNFAISVGPVFSQGKNRVSLALAYENENAEVDLNNSYDRKRVTLRYDRQLPRDFTMFASVRFQETDYQGYDPLFREFRKDDSLHLSAGLSRVFWRSADTRRGLSGQLSHTRSDVDSNISLYEYTKNVTTMALTYSF